MPYLKPLPNTTTASAPYWQGLREHRLRIRRCRSCGDFGWPAYQACRGCLSEDLDWVDASGDATVWSYSIVHRGPGAFNLEVPYVVVLAKLAEEPRANIVMGNLVNCDPDTVTIGMPIKATYEDIEGHDLTMLRFEPREVTT
jgi:uncharacterized OB-fold protein